MEGLPLASDPNLIAGLERSEDAGVYKLSEELAIVQTLDFFTPIVDDPYQFGQIAVTNALSDVYAMGATPLTGMNIVCFPVKTMDMSVLREILRGGLDKMHEAGVVLVGGHSVEDNELKYGLSVTGVIHPSRVLFNTGCQPGDKLILTKPLGVGIINTAVKGQEASQESVDAAVRSMTTLNKTAALLMQTVPVSACTDVTGFGLLGHACEMIENQDVGMVIDSAAVPFIAEATDLAEWGLIPGGMYRNQEYRSHMIDMDEGIPVPLQAVLFDPQTSGGLLISVPAGSADALLVAMHEEGVVDAAIIGEVRPEPKGRIVVR